MTMVLWIRGNRECRAIVNKQHRWCGEDVTKLMEQIAQPQDLLTSSCCSNILCLCSRQCNNALKSIAPADGTSAHLHHITTGRASIVWIATMISISEQLSRIRDGEVCQLVVKSSVQIAEEVLHNFPVLKTRILAKVCKHTNSVGDIRTSCCGQVEE